MLGYTPAAPSDWFSLFESLLRLFTICATISGGVALIAVIFFWERIATWYEKPWPKGIVTSVRLVSACAAIGNSHTAHAWDSTLVFIALGFFLWEVVSLLGDWKLDRSVVEVEQDLEVAAFEVKRLSLLDSYLNRITHQKREWIRCAVRESPVSRHTIDLVRAGMQVGPCIRHILEALTQLLEVIANDEGHQQFNFRVGLYVERDGYLVAPHGFNHATRSSDPFRTYGENREWFRLDDSRNRSHAVRCIREARMLIVSNCATAPDFEFFDEHQKSYIASLVAYPLHDFRPDCIGTRRAALVIDTNIPGFFEEDDHEAIDSILKEFALRVDLEYSIRQLIGPVPVGDDDDSKRE